MATPYHVIFAPTAVRQMQSLSSKHQKIMLQLAEALAVNPRPPDVKKIEGLAGLYCEALSPHRMIYKIEDQEILILLIK